MSPDFKDMKTRKDRMYERDSIDHAYRVATVSCYVLLVSFSLVAVDLFMHVIYGA